MKRVIRQLLSTKKADCGVFVYVCAHQDAVGGKARDDRAIERERGLRWGRGGGMDEAVTLLCETSGSEK